MDAFRVVRDFERAVADYTGAPFCVVVNSCTNALLLACAYHKVHEVSIPKFTYVGVAQSVLNAGGWCTFRDEIWNGQYQLKPYPIWDAARRFTSGMYRDGTMQCVSFHVSKILGLDQGGAILHDNPAADEWLRRARFDGRAEGVHPKDDDFTRGYHCYISPPVAAHGIWRLSCLPRHNANLPRSDYSDLSKATVFQSQGGRLDHIDPHTLLQKYPVTTGGYLYAQGNSYSPRNSLGADAVKLQSYTPSELTTPEHKDLWALYEKAQTPREWHRELFDYAAEIGITIFSSAFSIEGVYFLKALGAPAIKIASAEACDIDLVLEARETGLPLIISTGMGQVLPCADVVLHCVSQYPATIESANLNAIRTLRDWFQLPLVGLSDHTPGYETAIAATALGAVMIEKHFKLDDDCIDAAYSLNPEQFAAMCKAVRAIWHGMGDGVIRPTGQPRRR